jgi:hypothetical protein
MVHFESAKRQGAQESDYEKMIVTEYGQPKYGLNAREFVESIKFFKK